MKEVNIYVKSSCKYLSENRIGAWITVLDYKGNTKVLRGSANETTDKRMLMTGIIEGLKQLKEPCLINIHTASVIGLKSKANKDLKELFFNAIEINNHEFKEVVTDKYDYKLSSMMKKYYKTICSESIR